MASEKLEHVWHLCFRFVCCDSFFIFIFSICMLVCRVYVCVTVYVCIYILLLLFVCVCFLFCCCCLDFPCLCLFVWNKQSIVELHCFPTGNTFELSVCSYFILLY